MTSFPPIPLFSPRDEYANNWQKSMKHEFQCDFNWHLLWIYGPDIPEDTNRFHQESPLLSWPNTQSLRGREQLTEWDNRNRKRRRRCWSLDNCHQLTPSEEEFHSPDILGIPQPGWRNNETVQLMLVFKVEWIINISWRKSVTVHEPFHPRNILPWT